MSSDHNKGIIRRFFELINVGNLGEFDTVVAAPFLEEEQLFYAWVRSIFPDFTLAIENVIVEDDQVAIRFRVHATHHGEWRGIAPTGRHVSWTGMQWFRLHAGKIVDHDIAANQLDVLEQLTAAPANAASTDHSEIIDVSSQRASG